MISSVTEKPPRPTRPRLPNLPASTGVVAARSTRVIQHNTQRLGGTGDSTTWDRPYHALTPCSHAPRRKPIANRVNWRQQCTKIDTATRVCATGSYVSTAAHIAAGAFLMRL